MPSSGAFDSIAPVNRTCPACGTTYPNQVAFCGKDGTITIQDQEPADFDARLGTKLGRYIVAARVADGAMGRVFEGRDPDTKERVAIKVLHEQVARDRVAVERFKREFEAATEIKHPNVVKVLEFGETPEGSYFLTMEYLQGEELGKLVGRGTPVLTDRVLRVVAQTAAALDQAHSFGFIHRDLKPDNIFLCVTPEGDSVRILDFGSVKMQMETGAKLTAFGTTLGSPYYMSPEQAMGKQDVDQRSDVFALAAIVYEMLTAKIAFDAPNVAMILMKIMNETPPPPSSRNGAVPAAVDDVVDKGLRKDKQTRYGSAGELASALITAFGLSGTVEEFASKSQADIAAALATAKPPEPKPFGQPSLAPTPPASAGAPKHALKATAVGGQMPVIVVPPQPSMPTVPVSKSMGSGMMIGLAVGAVVLLGLIVLLFR